MSDENVLLIAHQDGPQTLRLIKGGYCIKDGRIAISIEIENLNDESWPPCALFSIYNCPTDGELTVGTVFECNGGMFADDADDVGATQARAYFTFHAEHVYVKWTVIDRRRDVVVFRLEAKHDDVDYYDERAKSCPTTGTFALSKKAMKELWIPG